jgi:hypothetical protein
MYGPFLAIARKKRCSREIFRLRGAARRGGKTRGGGARAGAASDVSRGAHDRARRGERARSARVRRASDVTFPLRWRTHSLQ